MKYSLFLLIFCFIIQVKSQTNYKYENFGNRSILLNGNVTGSVDDLGATYYNPARLALIEDPVFAAAIPGSTKIPLPNIPPILIATIDSSVNFLSSFFKFFTFYAK